MNLTPLANEQEINLWLMVFEHDLKQNLPTETAVEQADYAVLAFRCRATLGFPSHKWLKEEIFTLEPQIHPSNNL